MTTEMRGPVTVRIVVDISIGAIDEVAHPMRSQDEWVGRAFGEVDRLVGQLRSQLLNGFDDTKGYMGRITEATVRDTRIDAGQSRYRRRTGKSEGQ